MRISDWSSDVCSSDLLAEALDLVEVEIVAACDPGFVEHLRNQVLLPVALGDQVMESAHGSSRVLRKATGRQQVSTAKTHADRGPRAVTPYLTTERSDKNGRAALKERVRK